ncbi:hypothetical protein ACFP81_10725 [Deinococcus lacus]|uniref:Uncharacterized protein n=1 Tax=Deinococcus lacus TaxID=392561 RepID=A0ABW1YFW1_9DEIO
MVELVATNEGFMAGDSLNFSMETPLGVKIITHQLDELGYIPSKTEKYWAHIGLLSPTESMRLEDFRIDVGTEPRDIQINMRVTGRNLPVAQVIPLLIRVE